MRFLADESCDFSVVRALRSAGHEVVAVAQISPRAEDSDVLDLALREGMVLLTEDKDFGQLVFSHRRNTRGVIFLRYPPYARQRIPNEVVTLVKDQGRKLVGCFVVVQPGRIRMTRSRKE